MGSTTVKVWLPVEGTDSPAPAASFVLLKLSPGESSGSVKARAVAALQDRRRQGEVPTTAADYVLVDRHGSAQSAGAAAVRGRLLSDVGHFVDAYFLFDDPEPTGAGGADEVVLEAHLVEKSVWAGRAEDLRRDRRSASVATGSSSLFSTPVRSRGRGGTSSEHLRFLGVSESPDSGTPLLLDTHQSLSHQQRRPAGADADAEDEADDDAEVRAPKPPRPPGSVVLGRSPLLGGASAAAASGPGASGPGPAAEAPLELPDSAYDVVKINHRGRRQHRKLVLRARSITNVRGEKITADHSYAEVLCVSLKDHQTLVIQFDNPAALDLCYESPLAMQIVQDLNRRLALRRYNEKRTLTFNLATLASRCHEELAEGEAVPDDVIERVAAHARLSASASSLVEPVADLAFVAPLDASAAAAAGALPSIWAASEPDPKVAGAAAPHSAVPISAAAGRGREDLILRAREDVLLRVMRDGTAAGASRSAGEAGTAGTVGRTDGGGGRSGTGAGAGGSAGGSGGGGSGGGGSGGGGGGDRRRVSRIPLLEGESEEDRVRQTVDRMVLDPSTEEGRARSRFLKNFNALERKPDELLGTVREFMDSLKQHVETRRADEIAELLLKLKPDLGLQAQHAAILAAERAASRRRDASPSPSSPVADRPAAAGGEAGAEAGQALTEDPPTRRPARAPVELPHPLALVEEPEPEDDILLETEPPPADASGDPADRHNGNGASDDGDDGVDAEGDGASVLDGGALSAVSYDLIHSEAVGMDIPALINRSLESAIVVPVYSRLVAAIQQKTDPQDDALRPRLVRLRQRDQGYFGIVGEGLSTTNWSSARYEMSFLEKRVLPADKLDVLLSTARAIYNSYNYDRNKRMDRELREARRRDPGSIDDALFARRLATVQNFFLAADDFFPIFVYVVVHANVHNHHLQRHFMSELCDRASLSGEAGYYLTVYEASLSYIGELTEEQLQALTLMSGGSKRK